jgi:uncharacterized protein YbjT (DUF2867 family)
MTSPILLTGGTGTLGRLVAPLLREAGHDVRVLSRGNSPGVVTGDLATGEGVDAAVRGVRTVVHCAGSNKGDGDKARTLVRAAAAAGVQHIVYISVVGADRVPMGSALDRAMFGYYAGKLAGERLIAESGVPWTTLRATQFHDLALIAVQGLAKLPVAPVPTGLKVQPVDAGEVAARLVELTLGEPAGLVPDMGGPQVYALSELFRGYLAATGKHRLILPVGLPGRAGRALRDGANLTPGHAVGRRTWEEFLSARLTGLRAAA